MRSAGRVVAEIHEKTRAAIRPGITTLQIDAIAREVLEVRGARSNFLNYHGFPAVICASPNEMIVHGIPGGYVLQEGDIVSIDAGAIIEGYHGDAAYTAAVGEVSPEAQKLMEVTEAALFKAIDQIKEGNRLNEIGRAVEKYVSPFGYGIVREYVGHGIGTAMHEAPQIPNYWPGEGGPKMKVGNVFAVEPMINLGSEQTETLADGWSVVTKDGSLSAHFEHTIAITEDGPEILTVA